MPARPRQPKIKSIKSFLYILDGAADLVVLDSLADYLELHSRGLEQLQFIWNSPDDKPGKGILDRLVHYAHRIDMRGEPMRKKGSAKPTGWEAVGRNDQPAPIGEDYGRFRKPPPEVHKAWIDPARKHPRTIRHMGRRTFMVVGTTIKLRSRMK